MKHHCSDLLDFAKIRSKLPDDWELDCWDSIRGAFLIDLYHNCNSKNTGLVRITNDEDHFDNHPPTDSCPQCGEPIPETFPHTYLRLMLSG